MAGNIVHAVATTNAIVGGLIVIEALKVLREQGLKAKGAGDAADDAGNGVATPVPCAPCPYRYTFVKQHKSNSRLLEPIDPDPPNPHCVVCGSARVTLVCDVESMTLGKLIEDVLKKKLGMNAPEVNAPETILYEQDDGLDDDEIEQYTKNCASTLVNLPAGGVRHDTTLTVSDFSQKFDFELVIQHVPKEEWDEETDPDGYILRGDKVAAADVEENGAGDTNGAVAEDVDDCLIVDGKDEVKAANVAAGTKRKRDDDDRDRDAKEIRIE
jgi:ubiquitin-like 1-activating enzyme E1 B